MLVAAVAGVDGYTRISWRSGDVSRTESGHRFALLLAGQLREGIVAEQRCNEPLCVRVDPGHVIASTQSANLRYAVAGGRAGDTRRPATSYDRRARPVSVREALRHGWDPVAYAAASGITPPPEHPALF
ncbi:hypothetical protein ACWGLC_14395 [Dietzia sp. NPDC055877]